MGLECFLWECFTSIFQPKKDLCIDLLLKIFMVLRERGALWALTFSLDDFMVLREREREVREKVLKKRESVSQPKKKGRCGSP